MHRKRLRWFFGVLVALSLPFYLRLVLAEDPAVAWTRLHSLGLMACPGLAAVVALLATGGGLGRLGWRWRRTGLHAAAYLLPLAACLLVYPAVWWLGVAGFDSARLDQAAGRVGAGDLPGLAQFGLLLLLAPLGLLADAIPALGEELGWRGFLTPELVPKLGAAGASVVTGLVWAAWHYPLIVVLLPAVGAAPPLWLALPAFTLTAVALSFVLTWLRLATGSVWTAVLLHASFNIHVQAFFDRLTVDGAGTQWVTGEHGLGLALVWSAFAVVAWRLRSRRSSPPR